MTHPQAPQAGPTTERRVIEIELTDGDPRGEGSGGVVSMPSGERGRPRGRSVLLLGALLAGGVVAAVATSGGGGGDEGGSAATTFDPLQVTTPPTLVDLSTLPPATLPRNATPGPPMTSYAAPPFDPTTVTMPSYEEVPGVADEELVVYDLLAAVAANEPGGTPMRSFASLYGVRNDGWFRREATATIANDPVAGRDSLRIEQDLGEPAEFVVDRAGATVYRTDAGMAERWETFAAESFAAGTGAADIGELFDALVTGPITTESLAAASDIVDDGALRRIDGGAFARVYRVTIPIEVLRPYGLLLLANVTEEAVSTGTAPEVITFDVYVTDQPRLALVAARFEVDDITFVLEQFFDRRPANVIIDLPAPDTIIDGAVTGAPAPATTTAVPPTVSLP